MIVAGIRTCTPIRQSQNFVGTRKKKDVPKNEGDVLFKKTDLKKLEAELKKHRDNPEFWERLKRMKEETEAEIEERRRSSIVPPEKLREPMTI
mgnify:CR=1 FL=1